MLAFSGLTGGGQADMDTHPWSGADLHEGERPAVSSPLGRVEGGKAGELWADIQNNLLVSFCHKQAMSPESPCSLDLNW